VTCGVECAAKGPLTDAAPNDESEEEAMREAKSRRKKHTLFHFARQKFHSPRTHYKGH